MLILLLMVAEYSCKLIGVSITMDTNRCDDNTHSTLTDDASLAICV